jgi:hypothetical protein
MVTLSHVYNEVTSEPTITWYASIIRKALKVLICYLINTQCGNPVSHGTHQSDSPFLPRLSPACLFMVATAAMMRCLSSWRSFDRGGTWLVDQFWNVGGTTVAQLLQRWSSQTAGYRTPFAVESPATQSPLVAAARNTFSRQLQTNFESFPNNCCVSHDCRLIGYFIINMWKCYLLFELPCNNGIG